MTTNSKSSVNDWLMHTNCNAAPPITMLIRCKFKLANFDQWRFRSRPAPPPNCTPIQRNRIIQCDRSRVFYSHLIVFIAVLSVSLLASCEASEFPERECCDPIYPSLPDSVPSESDVEVTTVDGGGGNEAGGGTVPSFLGGAVVPGKWMTAIPSTSMIPYEGHFEGLFLHANIICAKFRKKGVFPEKFIPNSQPNVFVQHSFIIFSSPS